MRPHSAKLKPAPLQPGDKVALVAPSSNIKRDAFETACRRLRQLGYEPAYEEGIFDQDLYFAGSVERRIRELHQAFADPDVRAIVCARGGYGANYLLPLVDLNLIRHSPKIFVGYSDVTCLLTYLRDAVGLVTFHGPMGIKDFGAESGVHLPSWNAAISEETAWELPSGAGLESLIQGHAEGELYGGCLSILVASLGTPYEIQTDGKLLFLEDVNAKPYQIDRMLMQLKLGGKLAEVRGIIFGEMLDCIQTGLPRHSGFAPTAAEGQGYTLQEVVQRIVGDLGIPVAYGLRFGHVTRENVTLPLGVQAALSVSSTGVRFEILESAVARVTTSKAVIP